MFQISEHWDVPSLAQIFGLDGGFSKSPKRLSSPTSA